MYWLMYTLENVYFKKMCYLCNLLLMCTTKGSQVVETLLVFFNLVFYQSCYLDSLDLFTCQCMVQMRIDICFTKGWLGIWKTQ